MDLRIGLLFLLTVTIANVGLSQQFGKNWELQIGGRPLINEDWVIYLSGDFHYTKKDGELMSNEGKLYSMSIYNGANSNH